MGEQTLTSAMTYWRKLLVVSTVAAALGALFAGWQILRSRNESKLRATFEHIREIVGYLQPLWRHDAVDLRDKVLRFWRREVDTLPDEATQYMAFLEAVDLLALAIQTRSVDQKVAKKYLRTLFKDGELINASFIDEVQRISGDPEVYGDLRSMLETLRQET